MKRKDFLQSIVPAAISAKAISADIYNQKAENQQNFITPPYLKNGDTIGITSPAGYITLDDIQPAVKKMQEWGFNIKIGDTIGKRDFTFGGTDEERLLDFQKMLNDTSVKAIMCARGGYGALRILDKINFSVLKKNPKWIIGFSDITYLHCHINSNYHIATLHSKMCNSFPTVWENAEPVQKETIESIGSCLKGVKMEYTATPNNNNKVGSATAPIIGGNLKTIETLASSKSDLQTKGKILFVEDTGEYLYSIDRMFWNLKRSGKLDNLKGLIIGGFKIKKDDEGEEFGKTIEQIVLEKIEDCHYPVCFNFPVGHQKNNFPLKCGIIHRLNVTEKASTLIEM